MSTFWLILILVINVGISIWNAYACGVMWQESKAEGGFFRLVIWSAATQSVIGFSMAYLMLILMGLILFAGFSPEENKLLLQYGTAIWYLGIIVPALGTGLVLTVHSWGEAIKRRNFASIAIAGWNTYAQVSNMVDAANSMGPLLDLISEGFGAVFSGKGDAKGKVFMLALMIAIVAILAGALTTAWIIQKVSASNPSLRMAHRRQAA